jgi:hypothetical protein
MTLGTGCTAIASYTGKDPVATFFASFFASIVFSALAGLFGGPRRDITAGESLNQIRQENRRVKGQEDDPPSEKPSQTPSAQVSKPDAITRPQTDYRS